MGSNPQKLWVGWLDFGEEDQRRARNYLQQFNADNTLDELGFGILRDSFADLFFPATNTIMTRTRYLVFVPALCVIVEREKLAGRAAERRLRELEDRLREALSREERQDVIGARSKEDLARYPSSIYWSALRRLGIFLRGDWGLTYYQNHLAEHYSATAPETDDDGLSHLACRERRNWDKDFCGMLDDGLSVLAPKGGLSTTLSFRLTPGEARYLRLKYEGLTTSHGASVLSHLLGRSRVPSFRFPWQAPHPSGLDRHVHHAERLSMLARGATLHYSHLLLLRRRARGMAEPPYDLGETFSLWWDATRRDLASWSIEEFLAIAGEMGALRRNDVAFIKSWHTLNAEAATAAAMLNSRPAQELIIHRERTTRPSKSRLQHPEYLQRWQPPRPAEVEGMRHDLDRLRYLLDYRAPIGSTFVRDIAQGLAEAD